MAVRRVRRVIRKIDPWTVLKVSLIFNAIAGLMFVLGVWVMWSLAIQRGIPDQFTEFFANFALVFTPEGELYFRVVVLLTIILVVVLTGLFTLGALMYNLISDIVGGVEIIVLEETYAMVQTRQAPLRPAVHMPANQEIDTVQEDSIVAPTETFGEQEEEPEEDFGKSSDSSVDTLAADEIEAPAADSPVDDDAIASDDEITVEDDELPIRAASEG